MPSLIAPTRLLSTLRRACTCVHIKNDGVKMARWVVPTITSLIALPYFITPGTPYKTEVAYFLGVTNVLDVIFNVGLAYKDVLRYEGNRNNSTNINNEDV